MAESRPGPRSAASHLEASGQGVQVSTSHQSQSSQARLEASVACKPAGPRRRVRAVRHSSDLVDGRGELYERCGRRTRHPSAVALPDGERARVEFVRSRGRRARATAALVGVASR